MRGGIVTLAEYIVNSKREFRLAVTQMKKIGKQEEKFNQENLPFTS